MVKTDEVQLRTDNICLRFGIVKALDGINVDVKR